MRQCSGFPPVPRASAAPRREPAHASHGGWRQRGPPGQTANVRTSLRMHNQPDARSPGQVPHYDPEHAFELRSTGGDAREPAHGGQLCKQDRTSGRGGGQGAHTGQLCANGGRTTVAAPRSIRRSAGCAETIAEPAATARMRPRCPNRAGSGPRPGCGRPPTLDPHHPAGDRRASRCSSSDGPERRQLRAGGALTRSHASQGAGRVE